MCGADPQMTPDVLRAFARAPVRPCEAFATGGIAIGEPWLL